MRDHVLDSQSQASEERTQVCGEEGQIFVMNHYRRDQDLAAAKIANEGVHRRAISAVRIFTCPGRKEIDRTSVVTFKNRTELPEGDQATLHTASVCSARVGVGDGLDDKGWWKPRGIQLRCLSRSHRGLLKHLPVLNWCRRDVG